MQLYIMISVASGLAWHENFNVAVFSDAINVINVELCMMVLLIEHDIFMSLSVALTIFQGHSNIEQF